MNMKLWKAVANLIALGLVLVSGAGCDRILKPGPEEVTQLWYEAVGEFDVAGMYQLTHP